MTKIWIVKICMIKTLVFPSYVWMWELGRKEGWELKNWCFWTMVLEKTSEGPLDSKEIKPVNPKGNQPWTYWKDWCWSWSSNTLAIGHLIWRAILWKRPWCWKRLRTRGVGDREWDGWMASLTQWTGVWANSGIYQRTGKPCVPQFLGVTKSWMWLSDWTTTTKSLTTANAGKDMSNRNSHSLLVGMQNGPITLKKSIKPNTRLLHEPKSWIPLCSSKWTKNYCLHKSQYSL